jgi:hypothetical protein
MRFANQGGPDYEMIQQGSFADQTLLWGNGSQG